ncbi:MAG: NFACT family protein [Clostridia bacterium]|nr:NFACT family protein [Clostridia bacterium]
MAFDGVVTNKVVQELSSCLIGGKIGKVHQPNKNELLFDVYANGKHYNLLINIDASNCRMHLTNFSKPNPLNPTNFCMLLRKHLIGMKIKAFQTYDLERIVRIVLEGFDELNDFITKELVIELMGKHSNVILLNSSNKIIDCMRHLDISSNSTRDILPAREYVFPTTEKLSFLELNCFEDFFSIVSSEFGKQEIDSNISSHFTGISKLLISYLLQAHNIQNTSIAEADYRFIYEELKKLIHSSTLECTLFSNTDKKDYVIINSNNESSPLQINSFLDEFYHSKETSDEFITYRNSVLKLILNELKKYNKRLDNMNQKLEECNKKDLYRIYGELITANLYKINPNENLDHIILNNYYENNKEISIPLDISLSPSMNAKKYFKKYNKLKNAYAIVSLQKRDTKNEIDYIESVIYELENAKSVSDIDSIYTEFSESFLGRNLSNSNKASKKKASKKKKEEPFSPLTFTIDGYTVLVGKNNKQNDFLTLKYAHSNDIWFHTKDIHGSHVVLKTNGEEIPQETINKCASLCAFYSKAKNSSNVAVDYTFIRYVKKPANSKPGMVIYTNFHTVNVQPNQR